MAAVATVLGMTPPAVEHCRVLEVGCSDGGNLIPMALTLPGARFLGCDLAGTAVAAGRETIAALGLANVELLECDLAQLDPAHGGFDYIIAHGVYSWVPAEVRDSLFALAQQRLAPDGVLFVSYNAFPGCRVRQAAFDILHFHVDALPDPVQRMAEARRLAGVLGGANATLHAADESLRAEFRAIAASSDSELCHDTLGVPNDPVYFHAFAAHAERYGLAFLAEAELHTMSAAGLTPEARALLAPLPAADREQYLDFVRLRRFRQSLLRRHDARLDSAARTERIGAMFASADAPLLQALAAGTVGDLARGLDPQGSGSAVRVVLETIARAAPGACAVSTLARLAADQALSRPLDAVLTDAFVANMIVLHVRPSELATAPSIRPTASPLARLEAHTREDVTTLKHTRVRIPDANARRLLTLLDGERDRDALVAALRGPAFAGEPALAARFVEHALPQFARLALLVS
jgi:SAM-dependent methyltransferase